MLSLVLAASNAPSVYRDKKDWKPLYESQLTEGIPAPRELAAETDDVIDAHIARIKTAHKALRDQLVSAKPDALVVIGYDDGVMFNQVQVPQFCTYTGAELVGSAALAALGEAPDTHKVALKCAPELAWEIHRELIDREFDMSYMSLQNPQGHPEWGASSAFMRPGDSFLKDLDIPVVPMLINCMVEPTPGGWTLPGFRDGAWSDPLRRSRRGSQSWRSAASRTIPTARSRAGSTSGWTPS